MKTNNSYINETFFSDDIIEYTESCLSDLKRSIVESEYEKRQLSLKMTFESMSLDVLEEFYEKEGTNIFAKIGNFILGLIHRISEFINKIFDRFRKNSKSIETDKDKVNKIINEHPDLRNAVCQGIREEWFTYADIASYEKDIVGLVNMLEKNIISNQKAEEKFEEIQQKFENPIQKIIRIGSTIAGVLGTVTLVVNSARDADESVQSCKKWLKGKYDNYKVNKENRRIKKEQKKNSNVQENVENINENSNNDNHALITKIMGKYAASVMTECNKRQGGMDYIANYLHNFVNKHEN